MINESHPISVFLIGGIDGECPGVLGSELAVEDDPLISDIHPVVTGIAFGQTLTLKTKC